MADDALRAARAARRAVLQGGEVPGTPLRTVENDDDADQISANLEKAVRTAKVHSTFLTSFSDHAASSDFK